MVFYRPKESVAADVIPFYRNGKFQLFYLRDYRDIEGKGEGTPWELLETEDFVEFEELGEVVSRGEVTEQDLYIFTGCIYEKDGKGYLFYTGHNPHLMEQGKPQEAICLAVSEDFHKWTKVPEFMLFAPEGFESHDFRDPFVFYNEETGKYNMLLAARKTEGGSRFRGCTAVAVSSDLLHWEVSPSPFYEPDHYFTHECPDLFQMGEWWYLVFSEFSEKVSTRYRMSKKQTGPFITPVNDTFDNRAFYAAKTVSDGKDRYVIGWNPTRLGDRDYAPHQWGGNIVAHKLIQKEDGTLAVDVPETVFHSFTRKYPLISSCPCGPIGHMGEGYTVGTSGKVSSILLGELEPECCIDMDFVMDSEVREFAVVLRCDENQEHGYYVRIQPDGKRMVFDRWPRKHQDEAYMVELERPALLRAGETNNLKLFVDGTVLEVYLNHEVAMSARMYDFSSGNFGLVSAYGKTEVTRIQYLLKE